MTQLQPISKPQNTHQQVSGELQPSASAAAAIQQIQAAVIIAIQKPRNEENAKQRVFTALERFSFADEALYSFPRGDSQVIGPSVYLARELSKFWGNMRSGWQQTADIQAFGDEPGRVSIEGFAWDLETNNYKSYQQVVKKIIYRKSKGWIEPDERELRELISRIGSILERNAVLNLLPIDLIKECETHATATITREAKHQDLAKRTINAFVELRITPVMLEQYLGHPLASISGEEATTLRAIFKAIRDGQATWDEYLKDRPDQPVRAQNAKPAAKTTPEPAPEPPKNQDPPPEPQPEAQPEPKTEPQPEAQQPPPPPRKPLTFADFNQDEVQELSSKAFLNMSLNRARLQKWLADFRGTAAEALAEVQRSAEGTPK